MSSSPDRDAVYATARARALPFAGDLLDAVVAFNEAMRTDLERIRAIRLPFVPAGPTPFDAIAWIDNGGTGSPFHEPTGSSPA